MGDYPSKAHTGAIHTHVRPHYLHTENSPRILVRAHKPSSRRGCVKTLGSPYYKGIPLSRIPSSPAGSTVHPLEQHNLLPRPDE